MMLDGGDTEMAFQELPYYKAILKSFFRRQIQHLLEELAQQTGEESVILTADVNNGTLSQLGSSTGRGFLDGRDEIKTQFLSYCLKRCHGQITSESQPVYQQTFQGHVNNLDHLQPPPPKRHRAHQASMPRLTLHDQTRAPIQRIPESTATGVPSLDMVMAGNSDLTQGVPSLGNTPVSSMVGTPYENTKTAKKNLVEEQKLKEEKGPKQDNNSCLQMASGDMNGPAVTEASSADDNETTSSRETSDNNSNQFPANGVGNDGIIKVEPGYDEEPDTEMAGTDMLPPDFGLFPQGQQGNYTALMGNDPDMFLTQSGRHIGTLSHILNDFSPKQRCVERRPRVELSLLEKITLIREHETEGISQRHLARKYQVGKTTVGDIIRKKATYMQLYAQNAETPRKRFHTACKYNDINEVLWKWYNCALSNGVTVSGAMIQEKALQFAKELDMNDFKASNGWLHSWKSRYSITSFKNKGEKGQKNPQIDYTAVDNADCGLDSTENNTENLVEASSVDNFDHLFNFDSELQGTGGAGGGSVSLNDVVEVDGSATERQMMGDNANVDKAEVLQDTGEKVIIKSDSHSTS